MNFLQNRTLWKILTSLRLTVTCLAFAVALVFLGTLAQVNEGLYQGVSRWFKAFFIWWGPEGTALRIPIFPGGYLIGVILLANLIAAHINRFSWGWKKVGIHLTHFGVILLLAGQLATDMLSRESLIRLHEGETTSYSEDHRKSELIFATPAAKGQDEVVSFSEGAIAGKEEIRNDRLPFVARVNEYHPNSEVLSHKSVLEAAQRLGTAFATVQAEFSTAEGLPAQAQRAEESEGRIAIWREALTALGEKENKDIVAAAKRISADPEKAKKLGADLQARFQKEMLSKFSMGGGAMRFAADRMAKHEPVTAESLPAATKSGAGADFILIPEPEVKTLDERNMPGAVLELFHQGTSLGQFLLWPGLEPQQLSVEGKTYQVALRFERYYHPFSLTLLDTKHDVYPGTDIPKNYQSRVRVDNAQTSEHREVDIYMNNPLRYAGLTFYQYQMGAGEEEGGGAITSTLEVVRNPSWLTPYLGCSLVALGMIYQFLFHLRAFIAKRKGPGRNPAPPKQSPGRQMADAPRSSALTK